MKLEHEVKVKRDDMMESDFDEAPNPELDQIMNSSVIKQENDQKQSIRKKDPYYWQPEVDSIYEQAEKSL